MNQEPILKTTSILSNMPDQEKRPTHPPNPVREVTVPKPSGEKSENSLPTFHNPPPPPPPPPKNSENHGS